MNGFTASIKAVGANQSGHWGVVTDVGCEQIEQTDSLQTLAASRHVGALHLVGSKEGRLTNFDTKEGFSSGQVYEAIRKLAVEAKADGRTVARCIITQFGDLSIKEQCEVLREARAVRDKTSDFTIQTIVCGAWNFFRVQEYWKEKHGDVSAALDRPNVFFQSRPHPEDILEQLNRAKLVSDPPSSFDRVCSEMVTEFTGGDTLLLQYIISSLKAQKQHLDAIEETFVHAGDSGEVADEMKKRARMLNEESWPILVGILRHQLIKRSERDIHAEDLRLSGFVTRRSASYLEIASPIVERVLRSNWKYIAPGQPPVYGGQDLARPTVSLNTAAYRLIARIENTLRNLIVLALSVGSDWTTRLEGVRGLSPGTDFISTELLGLAREIQNALRPFGGGTDIANHVEQAAPLPVPYSAESAKKAPKLPIIESARSWQDRHRRNTALELAGDSLIYFLTTGDLASILVNESEKIYPEAIKSIFPQKPELSTFLEHYVVIRSAVAHNQPVSLATLRRLETMCADLEKRICHAQPRS